MKRKSEVAVPIEPKIPSLSPFLREETLAVEDIEKDVDDFLDCYNKFVKYITEIYDKKEKTSATQAAHFILKFKELNRKAQFRLSISREKTKETKDAINKSHLMMQNLLYEALHLEKETNSCLEYKSLHEEIDLVSVEEFQSHAPTDLQGSETQHDLTLSRLHWELCERKNLSAQIEEAEQAETKLMDEINKKKRAYSDISTHLRSVFDSTQSLEDIFDMPMHHQEAQNELAETLSEPLYVLYTQMRVHSNLEEDFMRVSLVQEDGKVCVLVEFTEGVVKVALLFEWEATLCLITVKPKVELDGTLTLSALNKSLLDPACLLSELPGDRGSPLDSPWIRAKMGEVTALAPEMGIPYLWCQRLAGTFTDVSSSDLRPHSPPPTEYTTASVARVAPARPLTRLMEDIRHRVRSRVLLAEELGRVATSKSCGTSDWEWSSFSLFQDAPDTASFVSSGLASEQCFFLTGVFRSPKHPRLSAPLWLVVPHNYPDNNPLVVLAKTGLAVPETVCAPATLKYALHMVEVEVNCFCSELLGGVLAGQVLRLHSAMVLMLEHVLAGDSHKSGPLFIGGKFPATKRPFKSLP